MRTRHRRAGLLLGVQQGGQLGTGDTIDGPLPRAVDTSGVLDGAILTDIDSGGGHTCAVDQKDHVFCWGYNDSGQLGDWHDHERADSGAGRPVESRSNSSASPLAGPTPAHSLRPAGLLLGSRLVRATGTRLHNQFQHPRCGGRPTGRRTDRDRRR